MQTGVVISVREMKQYGFLKPDGPGSRDLFFHATAIQDLPFDARLIGQRVEFDIGLDKGRPAAVAIWQTK